MGFLANKSYPCGKVVQGDYKDAYVYIWDENTLSLFREKELVFGKFVSEETHRKALNRALITNISSHTVENYEVLSQNQSSEDAGDVLNATLLFGAVGTIAASRQITKTNYLISVEFQSGKKSIIRLNEAGYENFLTAIKFKIKPQENKINEKTSQAQPSFSVADELKKFKELLDCGAISQEEFDTIKKQLLEKGITSQEVKEKISDSNDCIEKKEFNREINPEISSEIAQHNDVLNPISSTHFNAELYYFTKEEGGRHTPFFDGYRPTFCFGTTKVAGIIKLFEGNTMVMPGEKVKIKTQLNAPVNIDQGLRFTVCENDKTVGVGVVSNVIEE